MDRRKLLGALALAATVGIASPAMAGTGAVKMTVGKAGFIVGGTGGSGTLTFNGRKYPFTVGGLRVGLTIGVSEARMRGEALHMSKPSDIEGVYTAVQASAAAVAGGQNWVLRNAKGVELRLRGTQTGIEASLDLGGMSIRLK
ncbi:MAG: hypothetical protein U1E46_10920 [Hyphomicrobiales bacterium]